MMRPTYETAADKERERRILAFLQRKYPQFIFKPFNTHCSPWDAFCLNYNDDGDLTIRSIIEIKCRTTPIQKYPTYLISRRKLAKMWAFCRVFGGIKSWAAHLTKNIPIKPVLVVRFSDCLASCDVRQENSAHWQEATGGRRDRKDKYDTEQVFEIPKENFRIIHQL
jgi:hypothetical protein